MIRRAYNAGKSGNWRSLKEEFRERSKLSEWTFERLQEAYSKVPMEDIGRLSIARDTLRKSTDFLRRIISTRVRFWERDLVMCLPALQLLPFGRLQKVGVVWSWRRPQQKEEAA